MEPLLELAVELKSVSDRDRLEDALAAMIAEDPFFQVSTDGESGQTVLHGTDEGHLDRKLTTLIEDQGIALRVGAPQVAYRETITRPAEIDYSHKRNLGPRGEFARVLLRFEPGGINSGFVFTSTVSQEAGLSEYVAGVAAGLEAARQNGLLAGFPVIDMKAILVNGAVHDVDSSVRAFDAAARAAFKSLRENAAPVVLEPVVRVEVSTPEVGLTPILSDLLAHRGDVEARGNVVTGLVPLAGLLGYDRRLDHLTGGQGEWSMVFDHFAPVPELTPPDDVFPPAIGMRA